MKTVKTCNISVGQIGARIVALKLAEYNAGGTVLIAVLQYPDGEQEDMMVSRNIPPHTQHQQAGSFFCKNYSEGQPVFDALIKSGELVNTGITATGGWVSMPLCHLKDVPPHNCDDHPVPYQSDGPLGHGWECGLCGRFLQAG